MLASYLWSSVHTRTSYPETSYAETSTTMVYHTVLNKGRNEQGSSLGILLFSNSTAFSHLKYCYQIKLGKGIITFSLIYHGG